MLKPFLRIVALALCLLAPLLFVSGSKIQKNSDEPMQSLNVLLLGKDDASGLADVIMILNVNAEKGEMSLLQIPRDTYISTPAGCSKKINGASRVLGGDGELCKAVGEAMGLEMDGYISVDTEFVSKAVDLFGGVELCVPMDMDYDDPYQGLSIHLKKGKQKLDGRQAVGFVRYRKGYLRADIGRIDAQKIFLSALARTALQSVAKKDVMPLARLAVRYVKTDLPINKLAAIGGVGDGITPENILFVTMPGEEVRSEESGAWFYVLSKKGCDMLLTSLGAKSEFDRGHIFSDSAKKEFEEIYQKEIKARIYNAAEIDGEGIEIKPK